MFRPPFVILRKRNAVAESTSLAQLPSPPEPVEGRVVFSRTLMISQREGAVGAELVSLF